MSDIDEIKQRLDIVSYIGTKVKLAKAGRNFKGLCPFHNEKTPSFMVSPERQTFHCFGCGKGGSIFDFVMEFDHVDFVEALEMLAEKAGVKLERRGEATPEGKKKEKIFEVNHLTSEYYHFLLTSHPHGEKAREYLKSRGISDKSIKTFKLGYSPNSWEALYTYLHKKGYEDSLLEEAGLILRSQRTGSHKYYDRFRGRVMFTLSDHRGNIVGFSGRVLDPTAKEAKYINTSETPVYSKSHVLYALDITKGAIQKANEAILMEGEMDVISSFQAGIGNVVAIKGSALTEGHVNLLKRYTERVVFALDSDMAGDAASRRGIEIAEKAGLDMRVVVLPSGKDPDELARSNPGLLKKAVTEAISIYDYLIGSAMKRFDMTTAFGKKKVSDEVLPFISKIENPIVQGHYVKQLSKTLDISEELMTEGLKKAKKQITTVLPVKPSAPDKKPTRTREEKMELYILAMLTQGKTTELFEDIGDTISTVDFTYPPVRRIVEELGEYIGKNPIFLVKDFAATLPSELVPILDEAFLWDVGELLEDENLLLKEWNQVLREYRKLTLKKRIHTVSQALGSLPPEADPCELQEQMQKLTTELAVLEKSSFL